ncbi:bifunctional hydroxymethylpyrimidine kinase/phosphomethylpyrimidine kinase [Pseudolactococcus yaeyamensis]
MEMTQKALTIAGSDCSGGAGIQADLKTFSAHGVYGMSVITAVVAENTYRVSGIMDVTPDMIDKQIRDVFEDIYPDAVKIGMLNTIETMQTVANALKIWHPKNIVIDPVMYAKNGSPLMALDAIETLIKLVVPHATLITPNIPEAEKISGMTISNIGNMEIAAKKIHEMGCQAVLIKGGHAIGDATDVLYDGHDYHQLTSQRIQTKNTHGTGCTLSSAIASNLALCYPMAEAVRLAKDYVTQAIAHALPFGQGNGPTHHFHNLVQKTKGE